MELKSLLADTKEIEVEFPGMDGFKVKLVYLSKEQLRKIGEKSKTIGFDKTTHQPTETVDDKLFTKLYVEKALVGWKGLKYEYLPDLVLLNAESKLPKAGELEYSLENAIELVTSSKSFDSWISSVISDISLFNKRS
jgi:hypothetical protein